MTKVRLTRTTVVEYTLIPENYPEGYTIEQMAEVDANHDDREAMFGECKSDDVKWEIIEE